MSEETIIEVSRLGSFNNHQVKVLNNRKITVGVIFRVSYLKVEPSDAVLVNNKKVSWDEELKDKDKVIFIPFYYSRIYPGLFS